jgi:hypothetical protein
VSSRSLGLWSALGLALGCATDSYLVVPERPEFTPYDERIAQANRSVRIVEEGPGNTPSGDPIYYIAYITEERIELSETFGERGMGDPLWAEMQALGLQRQQTVDPATYRLLVIDARRRPGSREDPARRSIFESQDGKWERWRAAHFVLRL